jgi:hypothetical protein
MANRPTTGPNFPLTCYHQSSTPTVITMTRLSPLTILLTLALPLAGLALPAYAQTPINNGVLEQSSPAAAATSAPPPAGQNGGVDAQPPRAPVTEAAPESPAPPAQQTQVPPPPTLSDLGKSLRNYFTEEELSLLFEYMQESVIAAFKGEEVSLPPDLSFKLEILLVRLKKEGGHYMDNLISQLEKDLKNSLKEKLKETLTPPPIKEQPYNPWLNRPWR